LTRKLLKYRILLIVEYTSIQMKLNLIEITSEETI